MTYHPFSGDGTGLDDGRYITKERERDNKVCKDEQVRKCKGVQTTTGWICTKQQSSLPAQLDESMVQEQPMVQEPMVLLREAISSPPKTS